MVLQFLKGIFGVASGEQPGEAGEREKPRAEVGRPCGLVVEDEPAVSGLIADLLVSANLKAQQCEGLAKAVEAVRNEHPRIIFLDLCLPGTDAIEIMRQIAEAGPRTPVVLMSGHAPDTIEHVQKIGERYGLTMLDFLPKPFDAADVRARLKAVGIGESAPTGLRRISLEEALARNWLEVWYQPKIELSTMMVRGVEALVRARHPEHGLLGPDAFLGRSTDPLMKPLTEFVVAQAMRDWATLADKGLSIKFAVNVPMSVLEDDGFVPFVRSVVPRVPSFPGLVVELTEDEVVRSPERAEETALQLRLQRIDVAIDDFGQGYSSLARLTQLPFTELKLDRSFVTGCGKNRMKAALAQTVIDLAHRFGSLAVAEGVESHEDLRALMAMKCDLAQGYLFARPMPISTLLPLLLKRVADGHAPKLTAPPRSEDLANAS